MSRLFRIKCSCGNVINAAPGNVCPNCKQPLQFPNGGMLSLYRKGSPIGIIGGFGIYINNESMGYIANKETVHIPLNYGTYNLHIAVGMNRRCTDYQFTVTPDQPHVYTKVWVKPGFWSNTFVIEPSTADEMPE